VFPAAKVRHDSSGVVELDAGLALLDAPARYCIGCGIGFGSFGEGSGRTGSTGVG
jgi:hypothetical protein